MTLEQDLDAILQRCQQIISAHQYDPVKDACVQCGQPWSCWPRLAAEELLEGLRGLPLLDPALGAGGDSQKASRGTNVVEGWRRSSFSSGRGGSFIQVKSAGGAFAVRDSLSDSAPILVVSATEWLAFTQGVRAGEFDQ